MILKSEHHVTSLLSEISLLSDEWKMKLHNLIILIPCGSQLMSIA